MQFIQGLEKRLQNECGLPCDQATALAVLLAIPGDELLLCWPLPEFKIACLRFILKWARERKGWNIDNAAEHFEWTKRTQARYEGQGSLPKWSTVDIMLRDYGLSDDDLIRRGTLALARRR